MGGKIHIGTSGWHYGHWIGPLYPVDMKPEGVLAHYANFFCSVLVQLPPRWRVNPDRLQQFLKVVPKGFRLAFEFRDESWFTRAIYDLLNRHGAALCAYDLNRRQSPIEVTAAFVYVRLHGPKGAYRGQYDERTLKAWAKRFRNWSRAGLDAYCYFDNDEAGYAVEDALRLKRMLT